MEQNRGPRATEAAKEPRGHPARPCPLAPGQCHSCPFEQHHIASWAACSSFHTASWAACSSLPPAAALRPHRAGKPLRAPALRPCSGSRRRSCGEPCGSCLGVESSPLLPLLLSRSSSDGKAISWECSPQPAPGTRRKCLSHRAEEGTKLKSQDREACPIALPGAPQGLGWVAAASRARLSRAEPQQGTLLQEQPSRLEERSLAGSLAGRAGMWLCVAWPRALKDLRWSQCGSQQQLQQRPAPGWSLAAVSSQL